MLFKYRPAADKPFDVESGSWCFGQSYAVFNNYANSSSLSLLSLSIRTFSENAFVFEADRLDVSEYTINATLINIVFFNSHTFVCIFWMVKCI